jgi:hypothetical protein
LGYLSSGAYLFPYGTNATQPLTIACKGASEIIVATASLDEVSAFRPETDIVTDLGTSSYRWTKVFTSKIYSDGYYCRYSGSDYQILSMTDSTWVRADYKAWGFSDIKTDDVTPNGDNTSDCGASSKIWANVYTNTANVGGVSFLYSGTYYSTLYFSGSSSILYCAKDFRPGSSNTYDLGSSGVYWRYLYVDTVNANSIFCVNQQADKFITGSTCELGLLGKEDQEAVRKGEPVKNGFTVGEVLVWRNGILTTSSRKADKLVQAVASEDGHPIVLGAELIKVTGEVFEGDFLISAENGCAIVASSEVPRGSIIAQALESNPSLEPKLIKAMIQKM